MLPEQNHIQTVSRYRTGALAFGVASAASWLLAAILATVNATRGLSNAVVAAICALAVTCTVAAVELVIAAGRHDATQRLAAQMSEMTEALDRYAAKRRRKARRRSDRDQRGRTTPGPSSASEQIGTPDNGHWRAYLAGRYDKEVGN